MSNIGFRIYPNIKRPSRELINSFKSLSVANIADNMNRYYCLNSNIKPMNTSGVVGTAFTVKSRTADNLLFHKALDLAMPGDVIVVDVQGDTANAVAGEIMMRYAIKREIAGFLIDGAVRDLDAIRASSFPVYALGASPNGPYKDGPGEINVPVSCGGIVVNPGDIVVGDEDGVVIVSPEDAPELIEQTRRTNTWEKNVFNSIDDGTLNREWINKKLNDKGCQVIKK